MPDMKFSPTYFFCPYAGHEIQSDIFFCPYAGRESGGPPRSPADQSIFLRFITQSTPVTMTATSTQKYA